MSIARKMRRKNTKRPAKQKEPGNRYGLAAQVTTTMAASMQDARITGTGQQSKLTGGG